MKIKINQKLYALLLRMGCNTYNPDLSKVYSSGCTVCKIYKSGKNWNKPFYYVTITNPFQLYKWDKEVA